MTRQSCLKLKNQFSGIQNGGGRIRTFEGISRQIYSLIPLAAREPLLKLGVNFA